MSLKRVSQQDLKNRPLEKKRKKPIPFLEQEGVAKLLSGLEVVTVDARWWARFFQFLQSSITKDALHLVLRHLYGDDLWRERLLRFHRLASSAERGFLPDVMLLLADLLVERGVTVAFIPGKRRCEILTDGDLFGYITRAGNLFVYVTDPFEEGVREGWVECGRLAEEDEQIKKGKAHIGNLALTNHKKMYWSYLLETMVKFGHKEAHDFGVQFQERFEQLLAAHKLPPNKWK